MSSSLHAHDGSRDNPAEVSTPVAVHMSRPVVVARVDSTPRAAMTAMLRSGQRHLALVDHDGAFLGVVSAVAVAASRWSTLDDLADLSVMHLSPVSSMGEATSLMLAHGVDAMGVLDGNGEVVGILRWFDIVEMVTGRGRP